MSAASRRLRLAQPTISGQIRALEEAMEVKLFARQGRGLVLTEAGRTAYRYAEQIFALGREMQGALRGEATTRPLHFDVGVAHVVPKLVAFSLLEPAFRLQERVVVRSEEDRVERLLVRLTAREIDLVLSDAPANTDAKATIFSQLLGECDVTLFAPRDAAAQLRRRFPRSLDGFAFLMPAEGTALRTNLDAWFADNEVVPDRVAEFNDGGLLNTCAQAGLGCFAAPSIIAKRIARQYDVRSIGTISEIKQSYYALSAERRIRHPAALAVIESARSLFKA